MEVHDQRTSDQQVVSQLHCWFALYFALTPEQQEETLQGLIAHNRPRALLTAMLAELSDTPTGLDELRIAAAAYREERDEARAFARLMYQPDRVAVLPGQLPVWLSYR
jgi:hypothetical protein